MLPSVPASFSLSQKLIIYSIHMIRESGGLFRTGGLQVGASFTCLDLKNLLAGHTPWRAVSVPPDYDPHSLLFFPTEHPPL